MLLYIRNCHSTATNERSSQYPASSNISGVSAGAKDVVNRLKQQSAACPQAKFALVGYSQGAAVIRVAAKQIPSELFPKILAVVLYGDPGLKQKSVLPAPLEAKLLQNCAVGDSVSQID
jgi:cutinase